MSDEGDLLTCPYDRSHVVSKLRMGRHLVKCQANHPHIHLATCFYDFLHKVPPAELDEHLATCPSKAQFQMLFSTGEKPLGKLDHNFGKIFLTPSNSKEKGKEEDSGKTLEGRGYEGPAQSFPYTESKDKKRIPRSSTMITSHASNTPLSKSKMITSFASTKEVSANSSFLLKSNPNESKGKGEKEKAKKASKPKEESWDTDSSEDSPEETQEGAFTSSITACKNDDSRSTHTGGNNSFQGDDYVDKDGFVTVYSKRKNMKKIF